MKNHPKKTVTTSAKVLSEEEMEKYFIFLNEYWEIFGPIPEKPYIHYKNVKI